MNDIAHRTENDNDLHGDPDATHWAERFIAVRKEIRFQKLRDIADDEGAMLAWFAGAIETGRMAEHELFDRPFGSDAPSDGDTAEVPAGDRPEYITFFDAFSGWAHLQELWPENGQWCRRHWSPCPAGGYNGIGAAVAMMEAFAQDSELSGDALTPEGLNRSLLRVVKEHGAICCALGDQEMYRIWQDWPGATKLPGQVDASE
jgi:hypothetical protein